MARIVHEASTDHGSVLPAGAAAVIFDPQAPDDKRLQLRLPQPRGDDEDVPPEIVLMTAFYARVFDDAAWTAELYDWFNNLQEKR